MASVNLLEDPEFLALSGKPYDAMSEIDRRDLINKFRVNCFNNPVIKRAFTWENNGIFRIIGAQQVTQEYRDILERLKLVRAAHVWAAEAGAAFDRSRGTAPSYEAATAFGMEADRRLAVLRPGELLAFKTLVEEVKSDSALAFAEGTMDKAGEGPEDPKKLAALGQTIRELGPVLAYLEESKRRAFLSKASLREDEVIERLLPVEKAALDKLGFGLASLEAGKQWYIAFSSRFGGYAGRPAVAAVLGLFKEVRSIQLAAAELGFVTLLEGARNEGELEAISSRYFIASLDQNEAVAAAQQGRQKVFERERLLANYSAFEKTLADENGMLVVPATYPEPTEEEIKLAVARAFANFGSMNRDGSFNYGMIPATSFKMQVTAVRKLGCEPAASGGYICDREVQISWDMSNEMRSLLGTSIQADIMSGILDQASGAETEVMSDRFVLTQNGWISEKATQGAIKGIQNSLDTVVDTIGGVGCGLAEVYGDGC